MRLPTLLEIEAVVLAVLMAGSFVTWALGIVAWLRIVI